MKRQIIKSILALLAVLGLIVYALARSSVFLFCSGIFLFTVAALQTAESLDRKNRR